MSVTKKKNLYSRYCFAPGCTSGCYTKKKANKERGERNPSLFKAPNDPGSLQQWQRAIPRADKTLSSKDVVCELHFLDEDIMTHYETKLADGTISRIKRGRPTLKQGSIPRIFPNLPSYLSNYKRKRKPPRVRVTVSNTKKIKDLPVNHVKNEASEPNFEEVSHEITNMPIDVEKDRSITMFTDLKNETSDSNFEEISHEITDMPIDVEKDRSITMFTDLKNETSDSNFEEISHEITDMPIDVEKDRAITMFTDLKNSLATIGTPNKEWAGTFIPGRNEVVFAEWDDTYMPKKKVIIHKDMSYKVLLGKTEITFEEKSSEITNFEDLEDILKFVDKIGVCSEIELW
ncbi:uncharacterized protein LOC115875863 isoform X1 [Sitophilus oryzae]|uniref:Uncharacterized protein LOC115875863 isoform X1 n=1 Tax=Sitophilus oryzae TaxID=7048 RepID=A0A6J2X8T2_SITOR|nr:uncharacterized protein LOC115875863 isoform X1 [Sitophilus oryzae]